MADIDIGLLVDFHKHATRQGPGSARETQKAIELLGISSQIPLKIADIGCGSGSQTMTLAQNITGTIVAVDLFPEFLELLEIKAKEQKLHAKITTKACSMESLPFADNEFDIIWSEGAIYIMGFEAGIQAWKRFLKPKGFLVVSEISWLTQQRPKEVEEYWMKEYPQIDTIANKTRQLEQHGYIPTAHFVMPEYCWLENYYGPIQARIPDFLTRHNHSQSAQAHVAIELEEIRIYQTYKEYYSYVFYISQKR